MYRATVAPPSPSSTNHPSMSTDPSSAVDADALSRLIHRLPPTLSVPPWHKASFAAATSVLLPTIAYPHHQDTANPSLVGDILSACTTSGFFQLTGHPVSKELALSAESEIVLIFDLSPEKKRTCFPRNWPLGYGNDDDEESDATGEFFFWDEACLCYAESESAKLEWTSLCELKRSLGKVGLEVIGWLFDAIMFENPVEKDPNRVISLAWVSEDSTARAGFSDISETSGSRGFYQFVVGLRYPARSQKYSLLSDSGPVVVALHVGPILVTIGDIA